MAFDGGAGRLRAGGATGVPLLRAVGEPASRRRFRAAGVQVDLDGVRLHDDGRGLPIHGTMIGERHWTILDAETDRVRARFDYDTPELLGAFPSRTCSSSTSPVGADGLRVETSLTAGRERAVPVAFGWHPYFRLPGPVDDWRLELPECKQLELDTRGIPTGRDRPQRARPCAVARACLGRPLRARRPEQRRRRRPGAGLELRTAPVIRSLQIYHLRTPIRRDRADDGRDGRADARRVPGRRAARDVPRRLRGLRLDALDGGLTAVWGVLIGLGVAMALQPLPALAAVVLLSVENGVRKAWAFFLGESTVMLAIGAATIALHLGTSREQASRPAAFVTLVAGIVLLAAGAFVAVRARRSVEAVEPKWVEGSTGCSPGRRSCSERSCRRT